MQVDTDAEQEEEEAHKEEGAEGEEAVDLEKVSVGAGYPICTQLLLLGDCELCSLAWNLKIGNLYRDAALVCSLPVALNTTCAIVQ